MSTLKAARADNFYYPPDEASWSEQRQRMRKTQKRARNYFKSSSLKYHEPPTSDDKGDVSAESSALAAFSGGSRRGPVIRFEMPFKVICLKCDGYIAKGVRFDAERKAVGKYFSTTIYAFLMSCQFCHNPIVIQTDPENTEYLCKVGVRRKVEEFDTADAHTAELGHDRATQQEMLSNPLFRLERIALDQAEPKEPDNYASQKGSSTAASKSDAAREGYITSRARYSDARDGPFRGPQQDQRDPAVVNEINDKLEELMRINEMNNADWYLANAALRKKFRTEKKNMKTIANFDLELVNEDEKDVKEAKRITFLSQSKQIRSHFKRILKKDSDIFSQTSASTKSGNTTLDDKRKKLQFVKHIDSRLRRHAQRRAA